MQSIITTLSNETKTVVNPSSIERKIGRLSIVNTHATDTATINIYVSDGTTQVGVCSKDRQSPAGEMILYTAESNLILNPNQKIIISTNKTADVYVGIP